MSRPREPRRNRRAGAVRREHRAPVNAAVRAVRQFLLLVPAAWKAGEEGLPLDRAARVVGAQSGREVEALLAEVGSFDLPGMPDSFVSLQVEDGRVFVGGALHLSRPPPLSLREAAALLAALRPFERGGGRPVEAALRKIRRAIPEPFRETAEALARSVDFQVGPPGPSADALREAIERRVEVEVEYRAEATGTAGVRRLEPRALFHQAGRWYLAAWNVEKGAEHLFRLDRIASVVLGTRAFGEPKGPPIERYRRRHLYFESGAEREVRVGFEGIAAEQAMERWPDRSVRGTDGSVVTTAGLSLGNFVYGWVLGYAGQATILSPPEARAGLRARVEELLRVYR